MMKHEVLEKNIGLMGILIFFVVSIAGLVEIVPLFFQTDVHKPIKGLKPIPALELEGRDVYIKESPVYSHVFDSENLNLKKLHPVLHYSVDYQKMSGEFVDVTGEKSLGQKEIDESKRK